MRKKLTAEQQLEPGPGAGDEKQVFSIFFSHFLIFAASEEDCPLKMADSVPLDTAIDSIPIPIVGQKTVPNGVLNAVLSDDEKLMLAEHIDSDMEVRHALLISGKRNKHHVVEEMLLAKNEYLISSQTTKATLCK